MPLSRLDCTPHSSGSLSPLPLLRLRPSAIDTKIAEAVIPVCVQSFVDNFRRLLPSFPTLVPDSIGDPDNLWESSVFVNEFDTWQVARRVSEASPPRLRLPNDPSIFKVIVPAPNQGGLPRNRQGSPKPLSRGEIKKRPILRRLSLNAEDS